MKALLPILMALLAGALIERVADAAPLEEKTQPRRLTVPAEPVAEHVRAPINAARSPAALHELSNAPRAVSARLQARPAVDGSQPVRSLDAPHLARLNRPAAGGALPGRYVTQLPANRAVALKQRPPGLAMLGGPARITRSPARQPESPYAPRH